MCFNFKLFTKVVWEMVSVVKWWMVMEVSYDFIIIEELFQITMKDFIIKNGSEIFTYLTKNEHKA